MNFNWIGGPTYVVDLGQQIYYIAVALLLEHVISNLPNERYSLGIFVFNYLS